MNMQQADEIQADTQKQPTVFSELLQPIQNFIENQNSNMPQHHNQKYCYLDFFVTLIYFFTSEFTSLKLFINTHLNKGLLPEGISLPAVPYSTFSDAFERFSPNMFREVFFYLLSSLQLKQIPELVALGTLYCIDGSLFPVISSMLWADYTSNKQACRLHLCFELNRMIAVDFIIGSGKSSERNALRKMIVKGVTYIADRGYMCFNLFNEIVGALSHFVFRVKENLVYSSLESLDVQLPAAVQYLFKNVTDTLIKCTNDPYNNTYRLVCFQICKESYYLLTDRLDLTTFQIIMLYAYRWQIELFFRFLKRTISGIHLVKNNQNGVNIQFYALLIVALLELNLKQKIAQKMENSENQIPVHECNKKIDGQQKTQDNPIKDADMFFKMIGSNLKKYWKISIHWLSALRSLIGARFDNRVIEILGAL